MCKAKTYNLLSINKIIQGDIEMGFFKNLIDKLNSGFFYIVDIDTLYEYLNRDLEFSLDNNLEASANLYIYYKNEKHKIQIWNHAASYYKDEKEKGLIVYYDNLEYKSIDEFMQNASIANIKIKDIKEFFKIELIDADSVFLNEYKAKHPELKVEDYNNID